MKDFKSCFSFVDDEIKNIVITYIFKDIFSYV